MSGKAISPGQKSLAAAKGILAKIASICVLPFIAADRAAGTFLFGFVRLSCMCLNTTGNGIEEEMSCQRAEFLLLFKGLHGVWHSPENAFWFMLPSAAFIRRTHAVMVPTL